MIKYDQNIDELNKHRLIKDQVSLRQKILRWRIKDQWHELTSLDRKSIHPASLHASRCKTHPTSQIKADACIKLLSS